MMPCSNISKFFQRHNCPATIDIETSTWDSLVITLSVKMFSKQSAMCVDNELNFLNRCAEEERLRQEHPALKTAYDEYRLLLKLIK